MTLFHAGAQVNGLFFGFIYAEVRAGITMFCRYYTKSSLNIKETKIVTSIHWSAQSMKQYFCGKGVF